ncbi:hypothetical protein RHMOL_Rhmol12G0190600 [Rhododendron molle]|uniref:Uncharacterized protein n=1 Tax=Rhododendron molle TaxID=49168 RepID=A0ACC0LJM8_RHOML|nr:hypothetical protein RHMOL_Rhmol12G0190600 [Rhododendron molle]
MVTDSTTNASIPMAASNSKDFAKKKRVNRSAKLKQCKLDARREQWLSQVKNKGGFGDSSGHPPCSESQSSMENLEVKPRGEKEGGSIYHHYSDSDSASNSPTSHTSSVLGSSNVSGTIFTGSGGSSSSSGGSCSGSVTGEDEDDDGCLDDWEAVADALAVTNKKQEQDKHSFDNQSVVPSVSLPELKPEERVEGNVQKGPPNCRAWKPDDAFRPQTLPNLSKQLSFPMKSGRQYGCAWGCKNVVSVPTTCPICCEDLDYTDSRFLPCSCGFRLCLFCHKRILEDDGRCPGCRKQYDYEPIKGEATIDGGSLTFKLGRSCSMITRS